MSITKYKETDNDAEASMCDESSAYTFSTSTDEQISENEEDGQEIKNDDDNGILEKMEMEHKKRQLTKCATNMIYATATTSAKSHKDNASESKCMIFSKTFSDKEEHNLIAKSCNSEAIFGKFRTQMDKEMDSALQKLQHELFLLNSLLAITPKCKEKKKKKR